MVDWGVDEGWGAGGRGAGNGRGRFSNTSTTTTTTTTPPPTNTITLLTKRCANHATKHFTKCTLQALSSSPNAGVAKRGCLGRGQALEWPPAVCPCVHLHIRG